MSPVYSIHQCWKSANIVINSTMFLFLHYRNRTSDLRFDILTYLQQCTTLSAVLRDSRKEGWYLTDIIPFIVIEGTPSAKRNTIWLREIDKVELKVKVSCYWSSSVLPQIPILVFFNLLNPLYLVITFRMFWYSYVLKCLGCQYTYLLPVPSPSCITCTLCCAV